MKMTSTEGSGGTDFTPASNSTMYFQAVAGLSIVLASVVTVSAFFALLVTVVFMKKYRFHVQRLVMYLNGGILLQGISTILSGIAVILITKSADGDANSTLCKASAYLFNQSLWMEVILIGWITLDILLMTCFSLFTNGKMEVIQFLTAMLIPSSFLWVPFFLDIYGVIHGQCDITKLNNLTRAGDSIGLILFRLLPSCILLVAVFVMYTIVLFQLHRSKNRNRGVNHKSMGEVAKLQGKVCVLIGYPVIYALFYLLPSLLQFALEYSRLSNNTTTDTNIMVTILIAVMQNIGAVLISLVFVFDRETCKQLRQCNQLAGIGFWKSLRSSRGRVETVTMAYISWSDSLQGSSRQSTDN